MKTTGDVVTINESDFDEARYEALSEAELVASFAVKTVEPVTPSAPVDPVLLDGHQVDDVPLRQDGPTIEEFVASGYSQEVYPPVGYAVKESAGLEAYRALVASIAEVNAESAIALVNAAETVLGLDKFEAVEKVHPKHTGGRVSVIRAIGERRTALKAEE